MTVAQLKTQIDQFIITNGEEAITGSILNTILQNMADLLPDAVTADVTFSSDLQVNIAPGKSFGKFINGQTITANGLSAVDVITAALSESVAPVYNMPTLIERSTPSVSQRYEVGSTLNVVITGTFTPNDAGGISGYVINLNGTQTGTSLPFSQSLVLGTAQSVYQLVANYAQGPVKNDNLGNPYPTGRISAGALTATLAYTPAYNTFFGPVTSVPTNSAGVRALNSLFIFGIDGGFTPTLNTGTTDSIFVVAIKSNYTITSVVDQDALNFDLTSQYVLESTLQVADGGGNLVAYKIYAMTQAIPYTANHRHNITIASV